MFDKGRNDKYGDDNEDVYVIDKYRGEYGQIA